jgi:hypothetical protein
VSVREIVRDYGPLLGPLLGLLGVAATLSFDARRADREGRREAHAPAIEAVVAYLQMPYAIARRRHEPEHASAERARLTDVFRQIQADLAHAEALMRTDRDILVRDSYAALLRIAAAADAFQSAAENALAQIDRDAATKARQAAELAREGVRHGP